MLISGTRSEYNNLDDTLRAILFLGYLYKSPQIFNIKEIISVLAKT